MAIGERIKYIRNLRGMTQKWLGMAIGFDEKTADVRIHTLFALEDIYGIQIGDINGEVCLRLDKSKGIEYLTMFDIFNAWRKESDKLKNGEITKEDYDNWRYNYPRIEAERMRDRLDTRRADLNQRNK